MSEKKEFIKVELLYSGQSQGSYISEIGKLEMDSECDGLAVGDSYLLTKVEMTQAELDAMPEFTGF